MSPALMRPCGRVPVQEAMQGMGVEPTGCLDGACGGQCPSGYAATSYSACSPVRHACAHVHPALHGACRTVREREGAVLHCSFAMVEDGARTRVPAWQGGGL